MSVTDTPEPERVSRQGQRGPKPGETEWTDERVNTLETMWAAGASQNDIRDALGLQSRGAVSGKIARLGLSGRIATTSVVPRPRVKRDPQAPVEMRIGRVTLAELTNEICHFPFGDGPNYLFCGEPTKHAPYCAYCTSIAYRFS